VCTYFDLQLGNDSKKRVKQGSDTKTGVLTVDEDQLVRVASLCPTSSPNAAHPSKPALETRINVEIISNSHTHIKR